MEPATEQKPSVKYNLIAMHVDYRTAFELRLIKSMITTHFNKPQRATISHSDRLGISLNIEGYGESASCDCANCAIDHIENPTPASAILHEVMEQVWLRNN